ncbi:phage holin family protein [Acinetobacter bereziniae]|uniref:phage holin family protein n=1 Tax=Acinetobacter bereziniae TaxID=106648 RepID=UPI00224D63E1|nr:phage holin family protein [Acinetobacter bereziniae]
MLETIYSIIAVLCYVICAARILCFDSKYSHLNKVLETVACILIASLMAQSVNIIFFKDPVTIWDSFFSFVLLIIVLRAKGNVALIFRSKSS